MSDIASQVASEYYQNGASQEETDAEIARRQASYDANVRSELEAKKAKRMGEFDRSINQWSSDLAASRKNTANADMLSRLKTLLGV